VLTHLAADRACFVVVGDDALPGPVRPRMRVVGLDASVVELETASVSQLHQLPEAVFVGCDPGKALG